LTATGTGQITLKWTAPASNGGVNITSYQVYRGTTSGSETPLTSGGCSGLGAVLTCTDSEVTGGQTYFYKVGAVNAIGEGPQSNEASATPATPSNLLGNPGFENGSSNPAPWTATAGVVSNNSTEPPHSGSWDAWMCGYGTTHTDTLSQTVSIPSAASASLTFWRHIDTADTSGTADTLKAQVLNPFGTVLSTLHTWTRLDANTGYTQDTFDMSPFTGQTVTLKFTCSEDSSGQTSFVLDDTSLTASGSPPTTTTTVPSTTTTTTLPSTTTTTSTTTTVPPTTTTVPSTTTTVPSGTNLLGNPGFENGANAAPWTTTPGVINNSSAEPPHSGSWDAWLCGYGTTHTDTLAQTITLPSGDTSATLQFWLHIDTAETTTTTAYDTLKLQVLDSAGNAVATIGNWSNLNHNRGYSLQSFNLSSYLGQTITLKFTASEDFEYQTSFVIDDTSLTAN
jgi:hypothetical protein